MKVAWLPIGMLETEATFTEVNFAGDTGIDHPLEGAINGRPADALIFAPADVDEVVGAEVPLLAEKHVDDLLALAGALAALWLQPAEIGKGSSSRHGEAALLTR